MAENQNMPQAANEEPKKTEKAPKKDKKPNVFVRMGKWIARFFREFRSERKKVTWMSASDVRKNTFLVAVSTIVVSLVVLGVDSLFNFIITALGAIY